MSTNSQKRTDGKNNNKPKRGMLTILVVVGVFLLLHHFSKNPNDKFREISELEFRNRVRLGQVNRVVRVRETDSESTYLKGELKPANGKKEGELFKVVLVPQENEGLMGFIEQHNIECPVKEVSPVLGPMLMQMLIFFVPLALIYWFFSGRIAGGGVNPFNMGKSKAKMLNEDNMGKKRITFKDVAGADEACEEVQEIIEFLKAPAKFKKLGGRIPKGVLLVGPPGTGKTLLAKAIAGEAAVPFFSISGSDFEEMFVGVGASRVRDMFEQGKKHAPCLIFIDEIDAVGHRRSANPASGAHIANEQTLNAMLVEMDGFDANEGVIIIAATNRPDVLDPALLRPGRFDRQIYVDLPTLKGREDILKLHGAKITFAPDADLSRIARGTPGFSGADLANLLNEAALLAARKGLDGVTHEVLEEARDKVLWGRERRSAGFSKKERETTAWHEAGHALAQLLLENTDPLHKVTIIPRGRALGATMSLPNRDVLNRTKSYYLDNLVLCAAGRIAEEMFTNDISTGAAQDIAMATEIARNMVCRFAMSDKFGFQSFQEKNAFTTEEAPPAFSSKTVEAIDAEVQELLTSSYNKAKEILTTNRDKLELLAKTLFEKESMDGRDVEKLLGIEKKFEGDEDIKEGEEEKCRSASLGRNGMKVWKCREAEIDITIPRIMGIVNVTPDSFSDGGIFFDPSSAVEYAKKIVSQGADIIDIGGESTRPGGIQVDSREEQRRVLPVIKELKNSIVSIDTYHADTAEMAIAAGAAIINSVVPLKGGNDPMAKIAAQTCAGLVLTHNVDDGKNSPDEVFEFLKKQIDYALEAGCRKEQIVIDVGFGFSKTREEDLILISSLPRFSSLAPLLVGLSRKRTIDYILNPSTNGAGTKPDERIGASVAAAAWCAMNGASILRVHDVKDTLQAILVSKMFFEMSRGK